ncbi:MAG: hypothetical protein ACI4SH_01190 [Candidatus Scatosoma sp.]
MRRAFGRGRGGYAPGKACADVRQGRQGFGRKIPKKRGQKVEILTDLWYTEYKPYFQSSGNRYGSNVRKGKDCRGKDENAQKSVSAEKERKGYG